MSEKSYSYEQAGVSIAAGNALVKAIAPLAKATARPGADAELGGFGGFFDLKAAGYSDPLLVAANDGVGTKVKLAIDHDRHDRIGIDLVAMCVNDLIVQGAEPLLFLDYFATGKLDNGVAERVVAGIAEGCKLAGCALIGGETAEMPGMYAPGDYDLAGFCVGAVERGEQLTGDKVREGDVLIGLASSGVHSNGYSLVRRLATDKGWKLERPALFDPDVLLIEALIEPTRIYVKSLLPLIRAGRIHALAHITGGGLLENVPRVLPAGLHARIDAGAWEQPRLMAFLQAQGNIEPGEMARTFNCGIGMVLAVAADEVAGLLADLAGAEQRVLLVHRVGDVAGGDAQRGHAVRVHPDAHRLVGHAHDLRLAGTVHALQRVEHVDVGVVGDVVGAVAPALAGDGHQHHDRRALLLHRHALLLQGVRHRHRPLLGKLAVVRRRATLVGGAGDDELHRLVGLEAARHALDRHLVGRADLGRVGAEVDLDLGALGQAGLYGHAGGADAQLPIAALAVAAAAGAGRGDDLVAGPALPQADDYSDAAQDEHAEDDQQGFEDSQEQQTEGRLKILFVQPPLEETPHRIGHEEGGNNDDDCPHDAKAVLHGVLGNQIG